MRRKITNPLLIFQFMLLVGLSYVLIRANVEFFNIAWGTGVWLGEFSPKWFVGFSSYILLSFLLLMSVGLVFWKSETIFPLSSWVISVREKMGRLRWFLALSLLAFPVWFLQYTPWGVVFNDKFIRWILWILVIFGLAFFLERDKRFAKLSTFLVSLLLTTGAYSVAAAFINVNDYPFSLGWSEGNRMWDYSMMFGRDLYDIPPDAEVFVLLDVGRQFIGGLPFLFPGVTILAERFWVALTNILPYLLLGLAVFRREFKDSKRRWLLLGLWTFIFLKQGPIHPPLVISAIAVALVWRSPLWVGIPLIMATGYFAEESRFTWLFAPGIWIVMLEFAGAELVDGRVPAVAWWRAGILGLAGVIGGYFGPNIAGIIGNEFIIKGLYDSAVGLIIIGGILLVLILLNTSKIKQVKIRKGQKRVLSFLAITFFVAGLLFLSSRIGAGAISNQAVINAITVQPLLWYRLFPNPSHGTGLGILISLLISIGPLLSLIFFLMRSKIWVLDWWQGLAMLLPLLAFLGVGLVVSTKIGGGGDLHNLDMFLIGLMYTGVIAWERGGREWYANIKHAPHLIHVAIAVMLMIPGLAPLSRMRPYQYEGSLSWLVTLTDVANGKFLEMLPPNEEVIESLQVIRWEVESKKTEGEILFMDQRQLLTFGYVQEVELVPEYEKKVLINQAMSSKNEMYFSDFYQDLSAKRFSLIISEPLRAPIKDSTYEFGEENNAWVNWVVKPVLCYYVPIYTNKSVQTQLLVPRQGEQDCSSKQPISVEP